MPYDIEKNAPGCDGGFAVVKKGGDMVGCHPTKQKAERHMAALYANEGEADRKGLVASPYGMDGDDMMGSMKSRLTLNTEASMIEVAFARFLDATSDWPEFRVIHFVSQVEWDDARQVTAMLHAECLINVETPDECAMVIRIPTQLGDAICKLHLKHVGGEGGEWSVKAAGMSSEAAESACDALCMLLPRYEEAEDAGLIPDDEDDEMDFDADNVPQPSGLPAPNSPAAVPVTPVPPPPPRAPLPMFR